MFSRKIIVYDRLYATDKSNYYIVSPLIILTINRAELSEIILASTDEALARCKHVYVCLKIQKTPLSEIRELCFKDGN